MSLRRILFVLNGVRGGANLSVLQLAAELPARGYEACLAYPAGFRAREPELRRAVPRVAAIYLPTWHRLIYEPRWRRPIIWGGQKLKSLFHLRTILQLREICRRWDVRLVHTNTALTPGSAWAARAMGLPHVWHAREPLGEGTPNRFFPSDALTARLFRLLSTRILANSEASAGFFRRYLGPGSVTVVPNGIPAPAQDPEAAGAALRARLGIPTGATVIGMVASLGADWKRHGFFLDAVAPALARRPDLWAVIFGEEVTTPYATSVRRKIEGLAVRDRVRLAGHVEDVWSIMGAIDVLGHGTGHEGFGRVFVEAMFAGKPVVAPRGGGAVDIIEEGVTGFLVDPDEPSEMTGRLLALAEAPSLARRLGEAGRRRAREVFSLSGHADRICRIYDEILGAARGS